MDIKLHSTELSSDAKAILTIPAGCGIQYVKLRIEDADGTMKEVWISRKELAEAAKLL